MRGQAIAKKVFGPVGGFAVGLIIAGGLSWAATSGGASESAKEPCEELEAAAKKALEDKQNRISETRVDASQYFKTGGAFSCIGNYAIADYSALIEDPRGYFTAAALSALSKQVNSGVQKGCSAVQAQLSGGSSHGYTDPEASGASSSGSSSGGRSAGQGSCPDGYVMSMSGCVPNTGFNFDVTPPSNSSNSSSTSSGGQGSQSSSGGTTLLTDDGVSSGRFTQAAANLAAAKERRNQAYDALESAQKNYETSPTEINRAQVDQRRRDAQQADQDVSRAQTEYDTAYREVIGVGSGTKTGQSASNKTASESTGIKGMIQRAFGSKL